MRRLILLVAVFVVGCSLSAVGWGAYGHTMIGEAAAKALPPEMPAFFRTASDQLAFLNPEPDRWRDDREQAYGPWLRGSIKDHHVFLDLVPTDILRAPDRYAYLDMLAKRGIVSPIKLVGPVPGLLHLRILELAQQVRVGFRRWRQTTDPTQREWIQARIIDDAGILGHYVADAANPHHTTLHMFGWFGANPKGYATDVEFHGRFENEYVQAHIRLPDLLATLPPPRVLRDLQADVLQHLEKSHSLVERLYQLDRQERFGPATAGPAHKQFTLERLVDGTAMLRDLWWTAWLTSGEQALAKP